MIVKLLCRYPKVVDTSLQKELEKELDIQRIIQGDAFDENKEKLKLIGSTNMYEYGPDVFNMKDVAKFNEADSEHVCVRFYMGGIFVYKVTQAQFEALYQMATNQVIHDCIEPEEINKPKNVKSKFTKNAKGRKDQDRDS